MSDVDTQLEKQSLTFAADEKFWSTLNAILEAVPTDFNNDIHTLLNHWLDLTGARWGWFWLTHRDPKNGKERWEIFCSCPRAATPSYVPKKVETPSEHGMAVQYAVELNRPIFVNDLQNWKRVNAETGKTYAVTRWQELMEHGVQSFLSVPLKFGGGGNGAWAVFDLIASGICLHFEDKEPSVPLLPENAYMMLAKASIRAISSFFVAEQNQILRKLDVLAADLLTKPGLQPEERRKEYLCKVNELVREKLRVEQVSVFYETHDGDAVECIFTTGLADKNDRELLEEEWNHARYAVGKNVTGMVFKTGQPHIWQVEGQRHREPGDYRWKEVPAPTDVDNRAWLAWPIMIPVDPNDKSSRPRILGVIRCVGNRDGFEMGHIRPFDPIQLQTLDFITAQMAPILETMTANIRRERMVNVVKHDLYAPLRVIEDQAAKLKVLFETHQKALSGIPAADRTAIEHSPQNILTSAILAYNLAGSLGDQQGYNPEPVLLEADIIARLRDGLGHFAKVENGMRVNYRDIRVIPSLRVDKNLIERVLCNLILNAIKYGYSDTDIDVVGEVRFNHYAVRVENRGIKIPVEDVERIFHGSYRGREARQRKVGLGLGLKIARKAMLQHGGELILEAGQNHGDATYHTVFTMLFPKQLAMQERFR